MIGITHLSVDEDNLEEGNILILCLMDNDTYSECSIPPDKAIDFAKRLLAKANKAKLEQKKGS